MHYGVSEKYDKFSDRIAWLNAIGATCNLPKLTSKKMMGCKSFDRGIWQLKGKGKGKLSAEDRQKLVDSYHVPKSKRGKPTVGHPSGMAHSGGAASSSVRGAAPSSDKGSGGEKIKLTPAAEVEKVRLVPAAQATQRITETFGFWR